MSEIVLQSKNHVSLWVDKSTSRRVLACHIVRNGRDSDVLGAVLVATDNFNTLFFYWQHLGSNADAKSELSKPTPAVPPLVGIGQVSDVGFDIAKMSEATRQHIAVHAIAVPLVRPKGSKKGLHLVVVVQIPNETNVLESFCISVDVDPFNSSQWINPTVKGSKLASSSNVFLDGGKRFQLASTFLVKRDEAPEQLPWHSRGLDTLLNVRRGDLEQFDEAKKIVSYGHHAMVGILPQSLALHVAFGPPLTRNVETVRLGGDPVLCRCEQDDILVAVREKRATSIVMLQRKSGGRTELIDSRVPIDVDDVHNSIGSMLLDTAIVRVAREASTEVVILIEIGDKGMNIRHIPLPPLKAKAASAILDLDAKEVHELLLLQGYSEAMILSTLTGILWLSAWSVVVSGLTVMEVANHPQTARQKIIKTRDDARAMVADQLSAQCTWLLRNLVMTAEPKPLLDKVAGQSNIEARISPKTVDQLLGQLTIDEVADLMHQLWLYPLDHTETFLIPWPGNLDWVDAHKLLRETSYQQCAALVASGASDLLFLPDSIITCKEQDMARQRLGIKVPIEAKEKKKDDKGKEEKGKRERKVRTTEDYVMSTDEWIRVLTLGIVVSHATARPEPTVTRSVAHAVKEAQRTPGKGSGSASSLQLTVRTPGITQTNWSVTIEEGGDAFVDKITDQVLRILHLLVHETRTSFRSGDNKIRIYAGLALTAVGVASTYFQDTKGPSMLEREGKAQARMRRPYLVFQRRTVRKLVERALGYTSGTNMLTLYGDNQMHNVVLHKPNIADAIRTLLQTEDWISLGSAFKEVAAVLVEAGSRTCAMTPQEAEVVKNGKDQRPAALKAAALVRGSVSNAKSTDMFWPDGVSFSCMEETWVNVTRSISRLVPHKWSRRDVSVNFQPCTRISQRNERPMPKPADMDDQDEKVDERDYEQASTQLVTGWREQSLLQVHTRPIRHLVGVSTVENWAADSRNQMITEHGGGMLEKLGSWSVLEEHTIPFLARRNMLERSRPGMCPAMDSWVQFFVSPICIEFLTALAPNVSNSGLSANRKKTPIVRAVENVLVTFFRRDSSIEAIERLLDATQRASNRTKQRAAEKKKQKMLEKAKEAKEAAPAAAAAADKASDTESDEELPDVDDDDRPNPKKSHKHVGRKGKQEAKSQDKAKPKPASKKNVKGQNSVDGFWAKWVYKDVCQVIGRLEGDRHASFTVGDICMIFGRLPLLATAFLLLYDRITPTKIVVPKDKPIGKPGGKPSGDKPEGKPQAQAKPEAKRKAVKPKAKAAKRDESLAMPVPMDVADLANQEIEDGKSARKLEDEKSAQRAMDEDKDPDDDAEPRLPNHDEEREKLKAISYESLFQACHDVEADIDAILEVGEEDPKSKSKKSRIDPDQEDDEMDDMERRKREFQDKRKAGDDKTLYMELLRSYKDLTTLAESAAKARLRTNPRVRRTVDRWSERIQKLVSDETSIHGKDMIKLMRNLAKLARVAVPGESRESAKWLTPVYYLFGMGSVASRKEIRRRQEAAASDRKEYTPLDAVSLIWKLLPTDAEIREMVPLELAKWLVTPYSIDRLIQEGKTSLNASRSNAKAWPKLLNPNFDNAKSARRWINELLKGNQSEPDRVYGLYEQGRERRKERIFHGLGDLNPDERIYYPISYPWNYKVKDGRGSKRADPEQLKGAWIPGDVGRDEKGGRNRNVDATYLQSLALLNSPDRSDQVLELEKFWEAHAKSRGEKPPFKHRIGQQPLPEHEGRFLTRLMTIVYLMTNGNGMGTTLDWVFTLGSLMGTIPEEGKGGPLIAETRFASRLSPAPGAAAYYYYDAVQAVFNMVLQKLEPSEHDGGDSTELANHLAEVINMEILSTANMERVKAAFVAAIKFFKEAKQAKKDLIAEEKSRVNQYTATHLGRKPKASAKKPKKKQPRVKAKKQRSGKDEKEAKDEHDDEMDLGSEDDEDDETDSKHQAKDERGTFVLSYLSGQSKDAKHKKRMADYFDEKNMKLRCLAAQSRGSNDPDKLPNEPSRARIPGVFQEEELSTYPRGFSLFYEYLWISFVHRYLLNHQRLREEVDGWFDDLYANPESGRRFFPDKETTYTQAPAPEFERPNKRPRIKQEPKVKKEDEEKSPLRLMPPAPAPAPAAASPARIPAMPRPVAPVTLARIKVKPEPMGSAASAAAAPDPPEPDAKMEPDVETPSRKRKAEDATPINSPSTPSNPLRAPFPATPSINLLRAPSSALGMGAPRSPAPYSPGFAMPYHPPAPYSTPPGYGTPRAPSPAAFTLRNPSWMHSTSLGSGLVGGLGSSSGLGLGSGLSLGGSSGFGSSGSGSGMVYEPGILSSPSDRKGTISYGSPVPRAELDPLRARTSSGSWPNTQQGPNYSAARMPPLEPSAMGAMSMAMTPDTLQQHMQQIQGAYRPLGA